MFPTYLSQGQPYPYQQPVQQPVQQPGLIVRPPETGAIFITPPSIDKEWISPEVANGTQAPVSVSGAEPVLTTRTSPPATLALPRRALF